MQLVLEILFSLLISDICFSKHVSSCPRCQPPPLVKASGSNGNHQRRYGSLLCTLSRYRLTQSVFGSAFNEKKSARMWKISFNGWWFGTDIFSQSFLALFLPQCNQSETFIKRNYLRDKNRDPARLAIHFMRSALLFLEAHLWGSAPPDETNQLAELLKEVY